MRRRHATHLLETLHDLNVSLLPDNSHTQPTHVMPTAVPDLTVHADPRFSCRPSRDGACSVTLVPVTVDLPLLPPDKQPERVLVVALAPGAIRGFVTVAEYVPPRSITADDYCSEDGFAHEDLDYEEETDTFWTPAGWYEWQASFDTKRQMVDEVLAWAPLPRVTVDLTERLLVANDLPVPDAIRLYPVLFGPLDGTEEGRLPSYPGTMPPPPPRDA